MDKRFSDVINLIQQSRVNAIKTVNTELINLYWNVGAYIKQKLSVAEWGDRTVDELAGFIQKNNPDLKGFNRRGLYRMVQFYDTYAQTQFVSPLATQVQGAGNQLDITVSPVERQFQPQDIKKSILVKITWTNHLIIFSRCKTQEEREFYIKLCIRENYSKRELDRQISASLFERTMLGHAKIPTVLKEFSHDLTQAFKDSYVFEFLNLPEPHGESDLQNGLIAQMKNFILELGRDFIFVDEEYKVQVGNSDFYIDLVFYHRGLQCLVAFELKADKFKPEHLGQLNFYLEALDRNERKPHENPSIGILLCKDKENEVVEFALSRSLSPAMVAEYQMQLPDKKLLQQKLHELFEDSNSENE
ncbi:PDDEXK nuclease domain-containing protein [Niabella sp. W65]|nr:PDDEXK nuclease domain-containing protein [Niabella sp. W65]MCH7363974.1 PDDEXK nuclease domain-containing protein [Niabella sp. W65]ULT39861.1 PDDEXK nuclease domain-containing protein [Niabella sp. I65]